MMPFHSLVIVHEGDKVFFNETQQKEQLGNKNTSYGSATKLNLSYTCLLFDES